MFQRDTLLYIATQKEEKSGKNKYKETNRYHIRAFRHIRNKLLCFKFKRCKNQYGSYISRDTNEKGRYQVEPGPTFYYTKRTSLISTYKK